MNALARNIIGQFINEKIAQAVIQAKVEVYEITSHLSELSKLIQADVSKELETYGLECEKFFIANITPDEEDFEGLKKAKVAAASRAVQGEAYWKERQYDVMQDAAKNPGAGNVMAPGLGLGMGFGLGKGVSGSMEKISNETMNAKQGGGSVCPKCGEAVPQGAKFCPNCGAPVSQKRFCRECGNELTPDAKFCPNCGKKVE